MKNNKLKAEFEYYINPNLSIMVIASASDVSETGAENLELKFEDMNKGPLEVVFDKSFFKEVEQEAIENLLIIKETPELNFDEAEYSQYNLGDWYE